MRVVAIFGPTAVGKTGVAIELAALLRQRSEDPVAISSDALQVYRGLEVITGAASPSERERLEHRLIGFVPLEQRFSVGEYMPLAHAEIDAALEQGRRPLVVGGTGLYMRAALADLDLVKRAPGEESQLWAADTRHPTLIVGLTMSRDALYERVDERVDELIAAGAREEAIRAAETASPTARKALGLEALLSDDIELMKRQSRNYARRQLTWMRKMAGVEVIDRTRRSNLDVAREIDAALGDRRG